MNHDSQANPWLPRPWLLALLLSAVTLALFSPAMGYEFINYDDSLYVYENPQVARGFTWDGLKYAVHTIDGANWMPVTWLSYFLDASVYGTRPAGFHLTSILLHSASVALLFLALQRMTQRVWPALFVAALFAVHPQRSESVVWVAERKDVLSVFFWMLGLLAYGWHAERPGFRRMSAVLGCLSLGLMAKPMVVSFPLILLLLDFWPLRRFGHAPGELRARLWPLLREKLPLVAICAVVAGVTVWSQHVWHAVWPVHIPWYAKVCQIVENLWFYVQTLFVPRDLAIVYAVAPLDYFHGGLVALLLGAITVASLRWWWRWPGFGVGWFWFLFAVAPVVGVFRIGEITVADRYTYLPSIGLLLAVVYLLAEAVAHSPRARTGVTGALAGWVLLCGLATWADLPRWRNTWSVFASAVQRGAHYVACDHVAAILYAQKDYQDSLAICNRGLQLNPGIGSLYYTRGGDYYMLGEWDKALADFNRALQLAPDFSLSYYGRALVEVQLKQLAAARADAASYVKHGGSLDVAGLKIPRE